MRTKRLLLALVAFLLLSGIPAWIPATMAAGENKTLVYDEAGLLSPEERTELNELANQYGPDRETDFIIYTTLNPENTDVQKLAEDFYDEHGPGYDKTHGNAAILTLDTKNRELYLAGFYKAKTYLDDARLDKIKARITPYLSDDNYKMAFEEYLKTANRYMGFKPGVNPDNPLFNIWVQLGGALVIGGVVVGLMAYRSGGRVTVTGGTYLNHNSSSLLDQEDRYIRTTVTKTKISNDNNSGGGGGGGTSSGGHSHSGSRGSY
ncbi:TPM domain-containing protein [Gorillibacterium sp. CAU 1737]|uniref:TPM domain-containing protein n=1 Tax=Gorillibacterium sp. CAU 1737 TaxID=3140362 RepID=UPI0032604FE7